MENINTKEYWNSRFKSNWDYLGKLQTQEYAKSNISHIGLPVDFSGSILDFGCALGDAIPIYKNKFPKASLSGIDLSDEAISKCKNIYGNLAEFHVGDFNSVSFKDIIIASHVLEHITNDKLVVKSLLKKCNYLYVFVPYKEDPLFHEHVNYYDKDYYNEFEVVDIRVFTVNYSHPLPIRGIIKALIKGHFTRRGKFTKDIIMFKLKGY